MALSPDPSPLAPGPPGWFLALAHPLILSGAADGHHHPLGVPAMLRACRTVPAGEGMTSARAISMPSSLILTPLLLPDIHICELFSTLLIARNFLATERKLRFLCDFEKKYQFSRL